jgi:hypothetical protein
VGRVRTWRMGDVCHLAMPGLGLRPEQLWCALPRSVLLASVQLGAPAVRVLLPARSSTSNERAVSNIVKVLSGYYVTMLIVCNDNDNHACTECKAG